jgi:hypothetical protein
VNKSELDRLAAELMSQIDVASEEVIADERQVHLLDNDADVQIADYEPVYADELANSTDEVDLDRAQDELNERPDEVVGYQGGDNVRGGHERSPFRDDFVDALHQQAKAGIGPNGEILDEFDQRFQMQRAEHAALGDQAAFTRINPVSVLKGVLGGQIQVTRQDVPKTVAYWVGDDAETLPVTVTVAPVRQSTTTASSFRPIATVQFGTRGFLVTVEVDIGVGCQFTVSGSQVTVQVGMDQTAIVNSGSAGSGPMTLTGMLSFYPMVRETPVTRTIYVDTITAVEQKVSVPALAKNVSIWRTAGATAILLNFYDSNNIAIVYSFSLAANATMLSPGIPLTGDVEFIGVSTTAGADTPGRLIFELSL